MYEKFLLKICRSLRKNVSEYWMKFTDDFEEILKKDSVNFWEQLFKNYYWWNLWVGSGKQFWRNILETSYENYLREFLQK